MAGALFISSVLGALALVPVEALALGAGLRLWWTTASLLAVLGAACGALIAGADAAARAVTARIVHDRPAIRDLAAAAIRALAAAPALAWVSRSLFDGGFAATLPGARTAPIWLPTAGCAALAVALSIGRRLVAGPGRAGGPPRARRGRAVALCLIVLAAAVEYANRTLYRSEYPDVHAFLAAAAAAALGVAVFLAAAPLATARRRRRATAVAATALAVAVTAAAALSVGLSDPDDRWLVATRGTHTRQLARLARSALDLDRDGYAAVLGGGDCDDGDPRVNPAAIDVPGDGLDQDCDGVDAAIAPAPAVAAGGASVTAGDYRAAVSAWRTQPGVRAALDRARGMNMLLIVVDALRADAVADTPANRRAFPRLFELADASVAFSRAFSPTSGTDVALAALLTGRYAPFAPIDATLLEAIAASGRRTHAVLPREVLRWAGEGLLTRGLDSWDRLITDAEQQDVGRAATGHETTRLGLAFIDRAGDRAAGRPDSPPWLLWLHYFDVHEHHQMSEADPRLAAALAGVAAADAPARVHKYRAAVALVDAEVGRVIDGLRERGLWDRTIIVLASDHGESLGEDPRLPDAHGRYLYNALVRVPLLVRVPGVTTAGRVVHHPVSLVDLTATLLDLAGAGPHTGNRGAPAASGGAARDGRSLLPYLIDGAPEVVLAHAPPIPLHESEQHGVIAWPYKLLVRPADNLVEVYDLAADPGETRDLSRRDRALTARLTTIYKRLPPASIERSRRARLDHERMFRSHR